MFRAIAAALMLTGLVFGVRVAYTAYHQQQVDQDQSLLKFMEAATGAAPSSPPDSTATPAVGLPGGIYLRMTLSGLGTDALAVDGDWTSLKVFNTVHYLNSPAPGQQGNVLIAFHREPQWLDINKVRAGDVVKIDAIDRKSYRYRVDFIKFISAADVSPLKSTDGHDLTLITCDPPDHDYNRMVIRAHLVSG